MRQGADRERRGQVLATAVGHGGQRRQGWGGGSRWAPASHSEGDPLRGDGVDLGGDRAAGGPREGQGRGGQMITIQLFTTTAQGGDRKKMNG